MDAHPRHPLENRAFALFVVAITLVLLWTVWSFIGAIGWAIVLAVVFEPLNDRFRRRWPDRPNSAAGLTLLVIVLGLVIPAGLLGSAIVSEAAGLVERLRSGQVDVGALFAQGTALLPGWAQNALQKAGLTDVHAVVQRVTAAGQAQARMLAGRALSIGGDVLGTVLSLVVMLYLGFFLLRDGRDLSRKAGEAIPLAPDRRRVLADRFVNVVRATVRGSVVVALAQGAAGGVVMAILGVPEALLWGVVMTFGALIPAVGTGLVWVPVSLYLLAVGQTWQGIVMALTGAIVIGNIDNVLRPVLVGRQTELPDALVLITTLGGLSAFGFGGLVIGPIAAALFLSAWQMVRDERASGGEPVTG